MVEVIFALIMVPIEATAVENMRYDDAELVAQPGVGFTCSNVSRRFESGGWLQHAVGVCHLYVRLVFLLYFGRSVGFVFF